MFRDPLSALPMEIIQTELNQQLSVHLPNNGVINPPSQADNAPPVAKTIAYSLSGFINLPQVSKQYRGIFADERHLALDFQRKLLSHAALGEWEQAEEIYKVFPDLLSCHGTICHPNRTYVEGQAPVDIPFHQNPGRYKYMDRTAWQIALMNEEYEEAECMGKYMTEEEKKKQFAEIFPDGEIKKYGFDLEHAKQLLRNAFDAIVNDNSIDENDLTQMNQATQEALYALYKYAKPNPNQEHQIGLVFDANFYLEALKLYDNDAYKKFGKNWDKYSFWCIRVEEMLAGGLGTGYLRAHAQGIGNTIHRRGCLLADGTPYFASRRASTDLPGSHLFVGYCGGTAQASRTSHVAWGGGSRTFTKLMSSKSERKERLYAAICAPNNIGMCNSLK